MLYFIWIQEALLTPIHSVVVLILDNTLQVCHISAVVPVWLIICVAHVKQGRSCRVVLSSSGLILELYVPLSF